MPALDVCAMSHRSAAPCIVRCRIRKHVRSSRTRLEDNLNDIALAVFDMAGTTIEDSGQVPDAFTTVLNRHGIAIDEDALRGVRGASKRDAIRHFVAGKHQTGVEPLTDKIYTDFCAYLAELFNAGGVKPMPGAANVFDWLRGQNIKSALNTGFRGRPADLIIGAVGWRSGVVDTVICGDDVALGRPAPYL